MPRLAAAGELPHVDRALLAARDRLDVAIEAMLEAERLAEVAAGALADEPELRAFGLGPVAAAPSLHEAVHDLVDRAVAADGDDERMACERSLAREVDPVSGALGHRDLDRAERALDRPTHRTECACGGAAARSWVHDEEGLHALNPARARPPLRVTCGPGCS